MVNHSPERECEIPGGHALWKSGVVRIRTRVLWGSTEQISGGFTKELYLEKDVRNGFIKDHDGGLLMECKIDQKLPYTDLSCMNTPAKKIKPLNIFKLLMKYFLEPSSSTVYEAVVSLSICSLFTSDVVDNSGDAGWTPDQWGHTRYKLFNGFVDNATKQKQLNAPIRTMQDHADAWPFKEPVDALDVADYYDIIKDPIGKSTLNYHAT
ncbi:unnamed protein product [Brassica rapa]|uniref:Bromo domain-containing protein n=1 Tax=Brassica campestris TaxID=3711 RepID=A0A8D9G2E3_BRACM|nr:unnamed protein product [Brassica rapa]